MIILDRRKDFGLLIKQLREDCLGVTITEFSRISRICRTQLSRLEKGEKPQLDINTFFFLLDIGLPIHTLKNDYIMVEVDDYLRLKQFKTKLHQRKSKKLKFHFDMFCGVNEEYIKENYVEGVLEHFK